MRLVYRQFNSRSMQKVYLFFTAKIMTASVANYQLLKFDFSESHLSTVTEQNHIKSQR